jgi:hypothetical protein
MGNLIDSFRHGCATPSLKSNRASLPWPDGGQKNGTVQDQGKRNPAGSSPLRTPRGRIPWRALRTTGVVLQAMVLRRDLRLLHSRSAASVQTCRPDRGQSDGNDTRHRRLSSQQRYDCSGSNNHRSLTAPALRTASSRKRSYSSRPPKAVRLGFSPRM